MTTVVRDEARGLSFPIDVWRGDGEHVVVYSHFSGGHRRAATFLTTHLAEHGYTVAAIDHWEVVSSSPEDRDERIRAWIDNRVPDIRFLLDTIGAEHAGIVGHSFGGWTALAAADADARIDAVVALAPAGSANPRPGIIPARLDVAASRAVPTLVIAGDEDRTTPLDGIRELVGRLPWPTRLEVLAGADHLHYVDDIATEHEAFRAVPAEGDLSWIAEMRPIGELLDPVEAQELVARLTLEHFDAVLRTGVTPSA